MAETGIRVKKANGNTERETLTLALQLPARSVLPPQELIRFGYVRHFHLLGVPLEAAPHPKSQIAKTRRFGQLLHLLKAPTRLLAFFDGIHVFVTRRNNLFLTS